MFIIKPLHLEKYLTLTISKMFLTIRIELIMSSFWPHYFVIQLNCIGENYILDSEFFSIPGSEAYLMIFVVNDFFWKYILKSKHLSITILTNKINIFRTENSQFYACINIFGAFLGVFF